MPIETVSLAGFADRRLEFSQRLCDSFRAHGFAVVADHALPAELIAACQSQARLFFALPEAVKRRYRQPGSGGARGYTPFGIETAKGGQHCDLKEFWHCGRELPASHRHRSYMPDNIWPVEIPGFRRPVSQLFEAMDRLGALLLRAIALYLDLPEHFFDEPIREGNSLLRLLHYPPLPPYAQGMRAGAHEDINVISLLLGAEEAGLQVYGRDEKRWIDLNPPPDCIVCNVGDMLQRLSNDVLPSTSHRVVNPSVERRGVSRYSMPFFVHFEPEYLIRTLPGCIGPERPDRYPEPITANDFLSQRLREIKLL